MEQKNLIPVIKNLGMDEKSARIYLACLELGEATVQQIAERAKLKRTTLYYIIDELVERRILFKTLRKKKNYYLAESPANVMVKARQRIAEFEENLASLEEHKRIAYERPRVYYLYGVEGFKEIWERILSSREKEFRIITEGINFLDFVKEKYILEEIIKRKKSSNIRSRQLIVASAYARKIVAKDKEENRVSKMLPYNCKLPFTEIIMHNFVAFISPRFENMLLIVGNESFARSRKNIFEITWNLIPE